MSTNSETVTTEMPKPVAKKWQTTAGPIQTRKAEKALKEVTWESQHYRELYGITGVDEHSSDFYILMGGTGRTDVGEAYIKLGEEFNWTITRENYLDIVPVMQPSTKVKL